MTVPDPSGTDSASAGRPSRRAVIGYALLFALPVGVGVAVMMLRVTAATPTDALVVGPSLALAAVVFLLVVAVGVSGSPEP